MCSKCHKGFELSLHHMDNILFSFKCHCVYHSACLENKKTCIFHKSPLHELQGSKCKRIKCKNAIKDDDASIFCKLCQQEIITGVTRAFTHNQFIFINDKKCLTIDALKDFVMKKYITEHVIDHFIYDAFWDALFRIIQSSPHFYIEENLVWFITSFVEDKYKNTSNKKCTIEDILLHIQTHHNIVLSKDQQVAFEIQLKLNRSSMFQFVDGSTVRKRTKLNIHNATTLLSCLKKEGSLPINDLLCEDTDIPKALTTLEQNNKTIIANRRCYDIPERIQKRRKYFPFPTLHDTFSNH